FFQAEDCIRDPLVTGVQTCALPIFRVSDKAKLPRVLRTFVEHKGPAFLEVVVDQNACVFPMVGPGAGYKEMITGEFIPARQEARSEERRVGNKGVRVRL